MLKCRSWKCPILGYLKKYSGFTGTPVREGLYSSVTFLKIIESYYKERSVLVPPPSLAPPPSPHFESLVSPTGTVKIASLSLV